MLSPVSCRKEITSSSRFSVNMVAQFKEHSKVCTILQIDVLNEFKGVELSYETRQILSHF